MKPNLGVRGPSVGSWGVTRLLFLGALFFTLDSGMTWFKTGYETTDYGFPQLASPKFDVEPGFEYSAGWLEKHGVWLRASFRYQSLGGPGAKWPYSDGPRLGIRFRGRLVQ